MMKNYYLHPMDEPIVIFDGLCELCNQSVDFIIKWEKEPGLKFTANQNEPGAKILKAHGRSPEDVSTIFLLQNGKLYSHSTAALRIARLCKFPVNFLFGFIILPPFLRNIVYKWIARNRYKWFGKKDSCRIPTPEERARFLL